MKKRELQQRLLNILNKFDFLFFLVKKKKKTYFSFLNLENGPDEKRQTSTELYQPLGWNTIKRKKNIIGPGSEVLLA